MSLRRTLLARVLVALAVMGLVVAAFWPQSEILSEQRIAAAPTDALAGGVDAVLVERTRLFGLVRSYRLVVGQGVVVDRGFPLTLCGHTVDLPGADRVPEVVGSGRTRGGGIVVHLSSGQRVALPAGAATPCR